MEIVRTRDMRLANDILTNPVIAKAVSGELTGKYYPSNRGEYIYLTAYVEGTPLGLAILHPNEYSEWMVHFQVLPQYRNKYAIEFGTKGLEWVWANTDIRYLIAKIGFQFPKVRDYALLQGFYKQGTSGNNWLLRLDKDLT